MSSTCDHCIISFTVTVDFVHSQNEPLLVPNFKKADFESIFSKLFSTNWSDIITIANGKVQNLYDKIVNELAASMNLHVPLFQKRFLRKSPCLVKQFLKEKLFLYKRSKSDPSCKEPYKQVPKQYDKAVSRWHDHTVSRSLILG